MRLFIIAVFIIIGGCRQVNTASEPVKVVVDGKNSQSLRFLEGEWAADEGGWKITFDSEGEITSAVISLGRFKIYPGKTARIPMQKGGTSIIETGQWLVHYVPEARELTVKITIKDVYMELGDDVLEGKVEDIITGNISEDFKSWNAIWTSFPCYVAHTDKYPNFELSADPEVGSIRNLRFTKK